MSNVTDKLAELRRSAEISSATVYANGEALQLIAAVEALRAELIRTLDNQCMDHVCVDAEGLADAIITDAAPMLGERC